MAWSKRDLVNEAYSELAIAGYEFDLSAEELQTGVRRLDAMLGTWQTLGLGLGYNFGETPASSDLDQDSGLPLTAVEAVFMNLAVRIAASKGKALAASTKQAAKNAYDAVLLTLARDQVQQQQMPCSVPSGAGNRRCDPFLHRPDTDPLSINSSGGLDFLGN